MSRIKEQFERQFNASNLSKKWEIQQINLGKNRKTPSLKVFLRMKA